MKTNDFNSKLTSAKLEENLDKHFNLKVNLNKYDREQLEDIRNKIRTRVFQQEHTAGINDLLTNETYQKDKAMLELLNTRIKEMLGEDIKKLKDKMIELSEGKKNVKVAKHPKGSKKATKDYDGDGKVETDKEEVWGSRAKAAKKSGKPFEESAKARLVKGKGYDKGETDSNDTDSKKPEFDASELEKVSGSSMPKNSPKAKTVKFGKSKKDDSDLDESKPSAGLSKEKKSEIAKKATAGKDIGKKGKSFDKVAKAAGGGEKGKKIAAAAMWKNVKRESTENFRHNVRFVNESLHFLLNEDEEGKAKTITAASDIVNDYTSWMQRVGQYQTKALIELGDAIRADFGQAEAEAFKSVVAPSLTATLDTLTQHREAISNAVAVLAGEAAPQEPMGMDPAMDTGLDAAAPDEMNPEPTGDEFAAADAAAGIGSTGREMRESKEQRRARRLAEQHSIISKLSR